MGQRLSKLQCWILEKTLQYGTEQQADEGVTLLRKDFVELWRREHLPTNQEEWSKTYRKFNVSLTRSIVNLRSKGLIRTFSIARPELVIWGLGGGLRAAKFTGPLFLNEEQKAERAKYQHIVDAAREAKRKGQVRYDEVKADDKFKQSIQVVGLTEQGKELALMLKVSNSAELTISQPTHTVNGTLEPIPAIPSQTIGEVSRFSRAHTLPNPTLPYPILHTKTPIYQDNLRVRDFFGEVLHV